MKLRWDDRVLNEQLERNDLQGVLVSGFEDDGAGSPGLLHLKPALRTHAPTVARLQTGEAELRHRSAEIVAERLGGGQERRIDDAADGVNAVVFGTGLAAACAIEAGHGLAAAGIQRLAEDVRAAVLEGFFGGHFSS